MMRTTLLASVLCLAGSAQAVEYNRVTPERSQINFVSKQMGVSVDGGFKRFQAQMAFDPARPEAGKINLSLDTASIDAGAKVVNDEVMGKHWFDVAAFPKATFVSKGVRALGGNRYETRGILTIRGISREIAAPFSVRSDKTGAMFDGGFTLKRLDFGVGTGTWGDTGVVADEVQIKFAIAANTAPAANPAPSKRKP
jgi:polyisoprenoid-binding protein YceI